MIKTFKHLVTLAKNTDRFTAFFWTLSIFNAIVLVVFYFLLWSFIEGPEVVTASFWLLVLQVWIGFSVMLAYKEERISIWMILLGPLFIFSQLHNQIKIVVVSVIIWVVFGILSLIQPTTTVIWFMFLSVSSYFAVVMTNVIFQVTERMKVIMPEKELQLDEYILLSWPIMGILSPMRYIQMVIHKGVYELSNKRK